MPGTLRYRSSLGIAGRKAGYDWGTLQVADFSSADLSSAAVLLPVFAVPPLSGAGGIGDTDTPYPGALLTAADGGRVVGTSQGPIAAVLGAWLYARAADGSVYKPADTLVSLSIVSAAGVGQHQTDILTDYDPSTSTDFWTKLALASVPSEREVVIGNAPVAGAFALFSGDVVFAKLATSGAVDFRDNTFFLVLEVS